MKGNDLTVQGKTKHIQT